MNKQEKLTPENLQIIQQILANYDLAYKIVPIFIVVFISFVAFGFGEGLMSWATLAAVVFAFCFFGVVHWAISMEKKKIQLDIKNGFKEIIEGVISKKKQKKQSMTFLINEIEYVIDGVSFQKFEQKDYVKMEVLPISKTVLSVIAVQN